MGGKLLHEFIVVIEQFATLLIVVDGHHLVVYLLPGLCLHFYDNGQEEQGDDQKDVAHLDGHYV